MNSILIMQKQDGYYYLFSLDNKKNIEFIQIDKNSTQEDRWPNKNIQRRYHNHPQ